MFSSQDLGVAGKRRVERRGSRSGLEWRPRVPAAVAGRGVVERLVLDEALFANNVTHAHSILSHMPTLAAEARETDHLFAGRLVLIYTKQLFPHATGGSSAPRHAPTAQTHPLRSDLVGIER